MDITKLKKRIIDLSYKHNLSHISSCLNAVGVIANIYKIKKKDEPFILSCGHAGLALYVVLEAFEKQDAEKLFLKHGTHPNRDSNDGIYCSTGSLGQGITVGLGMAFADRKRNVYVVMSDGEMAEGSTWEVLRVAADYELENLRITCISNGYSAYQKVNGELLDLRMQYFYPSLVTRVNTFAYPDWLNGNDGHYVKLDKKKYKELLDCI